MLKVKAYTLPDIHVLQGEADGLIKAWIPERRYLVLGRSNDIKALIVEAVLHDGVEVLKRPSGGETVLLSPDMLVLSVLLPIKTGLEARAYFHTVNDVIINELSALGVSNAATRGISDISLGTKKILGSAVYRRSDAVFYHAVMNVSGEVSLMERYIRHPRREPDYRQGRSHSSFVTSLAREGYAIRAEDLRLRLDKRRVSL